MKIGKFLLVASIFLLLGCQSSNIEEKQEGKDAKIKTQQETNMKEEINMLITINNQTYQVELENNETVSALIDLLPLNITMDELNGNEKYCYLNQSLPTETKSIGTIHEGDIMLYGNNCIVLFYETFHTTYQYTRIGKIKDVTNLKENIGKGSIQTTFEIK